MSTLAAPHLRFIPSLTAVMLGGVMLCAAVARLENYASPPPPPPALDQAALTFSDLANGGVAVHDAANGQLLATVPARDDGFLRMTLRLLAAARTRQNIGPAQPFILTEYTGGSMHLTDPATGLSIELEAFGPSNIAEFARLFAHKAQP